MISLYEAEILLFVNVDNDSWCEGTGSVTALSAEMTRSRRRRCAWAPAIWKMPTAFCYWPRKINLEIPYLVYLHPSFQNYTRATRLDNGKSSQKACLWVRCIKCSGYQRHRACPRSAPRSRPLQPGAAPLAIYLSITYPRQPRTNAIKTF